MDPFTWDEAKNAQNLRQHGVSLDVVHRLDWSAVKSRDDARFDYGERRVLVFGRIDGVPYYVVIAPRDGTVRVLSARRMHEKEARRNGL